MLELALAGALALLLAVPHVLPLERVTPSVAAAVWLFALALRALAAITVAMLAVAGLPQTNAFAMIAGWCWEVVLPVVSAPVDVDGHPFGDVLVLVPALALAASLTAAIVGVARAAARVRRRLAEAAIGPGPAGSTVVEEQEVVVAVVGVGRPRIVVSSAALTAMDDDELEASLAHEVGHIQRRHRTALRLSPMLAALARLIPGTKRAAAELAFSLERDADEYAVRSTGDPLALASAICKAARPPARGRLPAVALALSGRGPTVTRVERLVHRERDEAGPWLEGCARALAVALGGLTAAVVAGLLTWMVLTPAGGVALHRLATLCVI